MTIGAVSNIFTFARNLEAMRMEKLGWHTTQPAKRASGWMPDRPTSTLSPAKAALAGCKGAELKVWNRRRFSFGKVLRWCVEVKLETEMVLWGCWGCTAESEKVVLCETNDV